MAADYYLAICQLIAKNIKDKNPKDNDGQTPRDYADIDEHPEIVDFFTEKNVAKDQKPDETD